MKDYRKKPKLRILFAVTLVVIYLVSFILVNIGFYSPVWYTSHSEDTNDGRVECEEVGLVSGNCRYPIVELDKKPGDLGYVIRATFYMMVTAMCLLYMSILFLVAGLVFKQLDNPVFMSFFSIVAGILYPAAAVLVLVGSIYAELSFKSRIGYAAIVTNIGGGLMLVCYIMLRTYHKIFKRKGHSAEILGE